MSLSTMRKMHREIEHYQEAIGYHICMSYTAASIVEFLEGTNNKHIIEVGCGRQALGMLVRHRCPEVRWDFTDKLYQPSVVKNIVNEVRVIDGAVAVRESPASILVLCWPPYDDSLACRTLRQFSGRFVFYMGEDYGGWRPCVARVVSAPPLQEIVTACVRTYERTLRSYAHTYVLACVRACVHAYVRTYVRAYVQTHVRQGRATYVCAYKRTYARAWIQLTLYCICCIFAFMKLVMLVAHKHQLQRMHKCLRKERRMVAFACSLADHVR
jgi:hypothetical protein